MGLAQTAWNASARRDGQLLRGFKQRQTIEVQIVGRFQVPVLAGPS
jgi:hypothetical protein